LKLHYKRLITHYNLIAIIFTVESSRADSSFSSFRYTDGLGTNCVFVISIL